MGFEGVAVGFISDNKEFLNCSIDLKDESADFKLAVKDFETGLRHFNVTEVIAAVKEFETLVKGAAATKDTRKAAVLAVGHDVNEIIDVLKHIKGPEDLVLKIINNMFADSEEIFGDLSTADKVYRSPQYMVSGRELGMALRHILIGRPNVTVASPT